MHRRAPPASTVTMAAASGPEAAADELNKADDVGEESVGAASSRNPFEDDSDGVRDRRED